MARPRRGYDLGQILGDMAAELQEIGHGSLYVGGS
jgi:hypothetical protein